MSKEEGASGDPKEAPPLPAASPPLVATVSFDGSVRDPPPSDDSAPPPPAAEPSTIAGRSEERDLLPEESENNHPPPPSSERADEECRLDGPLMDDEAFFLGEDGRPLDAELHARRRTRQRLLLLFHASGCAHDEAGGCPTTPHCADMKRLWRHVAWCADDDCREWLCLSSRSILGHYRECRDLACPSCRPVREAARPDRRGGVIRRKFSWKDYPELEDFLIANREEYLRCSAKKYTCGQQHYNYDLTVRLLEVASRHSYVFDEAVFSFPVVHARIRCYYESYVQASRKREADANGAGNVAMGAGGPRAMDQPGGVPLAPHPTQVRPFPASPDASDNESDDAPQREGKRTRLTPHKESSSPRPVISEPPGPPAPSEWNRERWDGTNPSARSSTGSPPSYMGPHGHYRSSPPPPHCYGPPPPHRYGPPPPHRYGPPPAGCYPPHPSPYPPPPPPYPRPTAGAEGTSGYGGGPPPPPPPPSGKRGGYGGPPPPHSTHPWHYQSPYVPGQHYHAATAPGPPIQTSPRDKGSDGANLFVVHIPNHVTNLDVYRWRYQWPYVSARAAPHAPGPPIQTSPRDKGPEGANLFVFHIPNHFTNLDMCSLFRRYEGLLSVRIEVDTETGTSRGFGFVSYDSPDAAAMAIKELNGFAIGKERLVVQRLPTDGEEAAIARMNERDLMEDVDLSVPFRPGEQQPGGQSLHRCPPPRQRLAPPKTSESSANGAEAVDSARPSQLRDPPDSSSQNANPTSRNANPTPAPPFPRPEGPMAVGETSVRPGAKPGEGVGTDAADNNSREDCIGRAPQIRGPGGQDPSDEKEAAIAIAHMNERDLMEDEDLSVLLQLAGSAPGKGTPASRSPRPQQKYGNGARRETIWRHLVPSTSYPAQQWSHATPRFEVLQSLPSGSTLEEGPSPNTLGEIRELHERPALNLCHTVGTKQHGLSYYLTNVHDLPPIECGECTGNVTGNLVWDKVKIREAASTDGRIFKCLLTALEGALSQPRSGKANCPPSLPPNVHRALQDRKARKTLADQIIADLNHSTLLHLAAGAEAPSAVDLCRLLVDEFGADFDTIEDGAGRTARAIAVANKNPRMRTWAEGLGTLFGRYVVDDGPPAHKSATCEVRFATDKGAASEGRRRVALKLVTKREHFERELEVRLANRLEHVSGEDIPPHFLRFDRSHAVELYRYHDETDGAGRETMCLAMPRADRSLDDIVRSEHVAGREIHLIRHVATAVATALQHLHSDRGIVHGDLKTRNVVRVGSRFQLIDFDASVKVGDPVFSDPIFVDKVSTAFCPPEIAKVLFGNNGEDLEALEIRRNALNQDLKAIESATLSSMLRSLCLAEIKATEDKISQLQLEEEKNPIADPTMDVWSFGVVLYQLLTGSSLFKCDDTDSLDGIEEEQKLLQWQGLRDSHLKRVLVNCPGATVSEIRSAKAMLKKCLMPNPCDRPQSMHEIMRMPFLNCSEDCKWTPGEKNCIRVLFSDPLVYSKDGELHPIERLNFSREKDVLIQSIRSTGKDIDLSFDPATDLRLQELAGSRCGCLHFSGHGLDWSLVFEDGCGGAKFVSVDELRKLIPHHEPFKLVFVSACDSLYIGKAFCSAGVPHVICCEKDSLLRDDAAANFARCFYCELAKGSTIKTAFDSAAGRVLVDEGEHESKKYTLLPHGDSHDVSVFVADDIEDFEEINRAGAGSRIQERPRPAPAPPVDFAGYQEKLYKTVNAIFSGEEKLHIISLVGENASLRNSLMSAAYYYVSDRLNTALNVKEIFYVRKPVEACAGTDGSLITALNQQLIAEGRAAGDYGEDAIYNICEALKGLRVLIIFDRVDEVSASTRCLLSSLCHVAGTFKVLLTCRREVDFAVPAAQTILPIDAPDAKSDVAS